jgi:hypothetical protein
MEYNKDEFGAVLVGKLLSLIIYRFKLHHSLNTFYFTKVAPFLINQLKDKFRISENLFLGMGVWGLLQGLEHLNKTTKGRFLKWTNGHPGFLKSLLRQLVDVFIGGKTLWEQFCPKPVDITEDLGKGWAKVFGDTSSSESAKCCCCGYAGLKLLPMAEHIDGTSEADGLKSSAIRSRLQEVFSDESLDGATCSWSYAVLFKNHLRMDLDGEGCERCSKTFQFLFANLFGLHNQLNYAEKKMSEGNSSTYENDELFEEDVETSPEP